MLQIRHLTPQDTAPWDDYVQRSSSSTCYHLTGWKRVVEETFGHRSLYLMALEGEKVVGILPLFLLKSLVFGRFLVSLPFFNYGGVVADDASIETALIQEAIKIARSEKADDVTWIIQRLQSSENKRVGQGHGSTPSSNVHKVSTIRELRGSPMSSGKPLT